MEYSDPWSSFWGGPAPVNDDHAGTAAARLPDVSRTPGAVAYLGTLAERWQRIDYAISNAAPYLLLDYRRAHGVWLDVIGSILGVPRETRVDEYYRRVLAAYAQIVIPRRRTLAGMLDALVALIGDEGEVFYSPNYPKGYTVGLTGFGTDELLTWDAIKILRLTVPSTYQAQVIVTPDDPLLGDDASGIVTIDSPLYLDDATGSVEITSVGHLSWIFVA
jgi:hypothetical protein